MVEKAGRFDITLCDGFLKPMLVHRLTEAGTKEVTATTDELPGLHHSRTGGGVTGGKVLDQHLIRQLQGHADLAQHREHERIERHVRATW
ncbi:hypothetical protein D3C84_1094490 [compost metagenome]